MSGCSTAHSYTRTHTLHTGAALERRAQLILTAFANITCSTFLSEEQSSSSLKEDFMEEVAF